MSSNKLNERTKNCHVTFRQFRFKNATHVSQILVPILDQLWVIHVWKYVLLGSTIFFISDFIVHLACYSLMHDVEYAHRYLRRACVYYM